LTHSVNVPLFAKLNRSYNDLNGGQLEATLADSVTNLVFLMEPGDRDWNGIGYTHVMPQSETAKFHPLSGIEPLSEDKLAARVCVRAMDARAGTIFDTYQVTPGWKFDLDQALCGTYFRSELCIQMQRRLRLKDAPGRHIRTHFKL
jgi:hypothetical protein